MKSKENIVRIALIGLGDRGRTALRLLLPVEGARITALCDVVASNVVMARQLLAADANVLCASGPEAYRQVCASADVDLVYICSDWTSHTPIAVEAMRQGKHAAVEVPAATTLDELQLLVATAESTARHCFLLENCCYDPQVVRTIAAIRRGDIGEVVHAEGCYYHSLDDRWSAWRLEINRRRRGDLYPTHELGPICQALDIGRTDALLTLVSMDSRPFSGPHHYRRALRQEATDFQNGDHTTTLIRTARGRTILLRHDVMTAQPYDRTLTFIGTRGRIDIHDVGRPSHDEMTVAMNGALISALREGRPLDISVHDLALWCSVIPLSEQSIARGFAPVAFP